jgi:succinate dehydrogenase/fumarate reductase flavoprotein subunit
MSNDNDEKVRGLSRRAFVKGAGASVAAVAGITAADATPARRDPTQRPKSWDLEADVVIIGSGPTGLVAALRARATGASVLVVEANYDAGGHGLINGGTIQLGGGTRLQKKFGIEDSADTMFQDLTDWSVVESNGMPEYRYNDRAIQTAQRLSIFWKRTASSSRRYRHQLRADTRSAYLLGAPTRCFGMAGRGRKVHAAVVGQEFIDRWK